MADDDDEHPQTSPFRAVIGLALIAVMILGVLFVMKQLQHAAAIQDCVAAGRTNCAPISTRSP
jgi:hypothetical protein